MAKRLGGLIEEALSSSVIAAFYEVYNNLGYGFLEHVYSLAMERELIARGHKVARELGVLVWYKGEELTWQRLDMVVDEFAIQGRDAVGLGSLSVWLGRMLHHVRHARHQDARRTQIVMRLYP